MNLPAFIEIIKCRLVFVKLAKENVRRSVNKKVHTLSPVSLFSAKRNR